MTLRSEHIQYGSHPEGASCCTAEEKYTHKTSLNIEGKLMVTKGDGGRDKVGVWD